MMGRCWPQSLMRYEIGREEPHSINCCRNSPLIFTEVEKTLISYTVWASNQIRYNFSFIEVIMIASLVHNSFVYGVQSIFST